MAHFGNSSHINVEEGMSYEDLTAGKILHCPCEGGSKGLEFVVQCQTFWEPKGL